MKKLFVFLFLLPFLAFGQELEGFKKINILPHTPVKNQYHTGTCWAFSGTSFIESEALRITGKEFDLSEQFLVYYAYIEKAIKYVRFHGKTQFDQGGLQPDVMYLLKKYGIVREEDYPFTLKDHTKLVDSLRRFLDTLLTKDSLPNNWLDDYTGILRYFLGTPPTSITYEGRVYKPKAFLYNILKFDPNNYLVFTSFPQYLWYYPVVLEIPDNWLHSQFWNVPLKYLTGMTLEALKRGYTVYWDADVSEAYFNPREAIADLPKYMKREITNYSFYRKISFENHTTTDDHLMHIIGTAKKGKTTYLIVKNSWGEVGPAKGLIYVSLPYFEAKTISVMIHKDLLPEPLKGRLYKYICEPVSEEEYEEKD